MSKDALLPLIQQPRRPNILIGDLRIFEPRGDKVLITVESGLNAGEGATFSANALRELLQAFYDKNF